MEEKWTVNRGKRKRVEDKKSLPGFKVRKSSSTHDGGIIDVSVTSPSLSPPIKAATGAQPQAQAITTPSAVTYSDSTTTTATAKASNLGLAGYSSDEED